MTTIFESNPSDKEGTVTNDNQNLPEGLDSLVGEGKKYATAEAALASLGPKEEHIATLEAELATLREDNTRLKTVGETLEALKAGNNKADQPDVDPNTLAELVDSRIAAKSAAEQKEQNVKSVVTTLIEKFGTAEKAQEAYEKRAGELGVNTDTLTDLASHSPTAVLAYFNAANSEAMPSKTTGDVNPEALSPSGASNDRTYDWWNQMRKDNEKEFNRPENQKLMHEDAHRLGRDRFFGRT